ncbi:GNAT family N-acetyltransferase, partial [Streptomyces sp. NPDC051453]
MLIRDAEDEDWAQIWPFRRQIVGSRETYAWDPNTPEALA